MQEMEVQPKRLWGRERGTAGRSSLGRTATLRAIGQELQREREFAGTFGTPQCG